MVTVHLVVSDFVDLLSFVLSKKDIDMSQLTALVTSGYSSSFESMISTCFSSRNYLIFMDMPQSRVPMLLAL